MHAPVPRSRRVSRLGAAALLISLPMAALAQDGSGADEHERLRQLELRQAQIDAERAAVDAEVAALRARLGEGPVDDAAASTVREPTALEAAVPPAPEGTGTGDDDVVIVAKRFRSKIAQTTQTVYVIGEDDFERRQTAHVSDLLYGVPGMVPSGGGNKGGSTYLFPRGGASIHSLVLLNGIPLNNSGGAGEFNFDGVTSAGLGRIEVLRGSYGLLYGSEAIGGVIWMESKKGQGPAKGRLTVEGGSFGTHRESLSLGGSEGALDYFVVMTNFKTDNDFYRNGYGATEALGRFGLDIGRDFRIETTLFHTDNDYENPTDGQVFDRTTNEPKDDPNNGSSSRMLAWGTDGTWTVNDWATLRVNVSRLTVDIAEFDGPNEERSYDPDGTPGTGDEFGAYVNEYDWGIDTIETRGRAMFTAFLNDAFGWAYADDGGVDVEVTVGAEYVDQDSRANTVEENRFDTTGPRSNVTLVNAHAFVKSWFVLVDVGLPDAGVFTENVVNTGTRSDDTSTFGKESSPYFGARTRFEPTDTVLRASYGEGFASPKPAPLYDPLFGNDGLEAELGETIEFGASQKFFDGDLAIGVAWYDMDITNAIAFIPTPEPGYPFGRLQNSGGTKHSGWEWDVRANLGAGFKARATITDQKARLTQTRESIRTAHHGSAGVSWSDDRWLVSLDWLYNNGSTFKGGLPILGGDDQRIRAHPSRQRLYHLTGRYKVNDALTVFGRVENATDYQWYARGLGTKALGIGFYVGAQLDF